MLGEGGLGTAALVVDEATGDERCLKLVMADDPTRRAQLRSEFQLLAGLSHPGLACVRDFGVASSRERPPAFYFTSDFAPGVSLDVLANGASFEHVRGALHGALGGLAFLHRAGIRHGDVKPSNILCDEAGRGVLIDLSCAERMGPRGDQERGEDRPISGTPGFVAPETLLGRAADARADLFGVGRTLLALDPLLDGGLPGDVRALATRLTDEDPGKRPADVVEVLEALGASAIDLRVAARQPRRIVGRDAELARVAHALEALVAGRSGPRLVSIAGARGAGKSRVLRELVWRAEVLCDVVEVFPSKRRAIGSALLRALDAPATNTEPIELSDTGNVLGIVRALDALLARGRPVAIIIDDADSLDDADVDAVRVIARSLTPVGCVLLAYTESLPRRVDAPSIPGVAHPDVVEEIVLGPLDDASVRLWAEDLGVAEAAVGIARGSQGNAAAIAALSARVLDGEDVASAALALRDDVPMDRTRAALEAKSAIQRLSETSAAEPEIAARAVRALVLAGRPDEAFDLLGAHADLLASSPRVFKGALESLALLAEGPSARLEVACWLEQAGSPVVATRTLEPVVASGATPTDIAWRVWTCLSSCALGRGDAPRALETATRALELAGSDHERAFATELACRAHVRLGSHLAARALAEEALAMGPEPSVRADLHEVAGIAASYVSDHGEARAHLAASLALLGGLGSPRRIVRALSYRAIDAFRSGDIEAAEADYRRALEVAEKEGLADQIARASLNLGTACHQRGAYAAALAAYERGERIAAALGQEDVLVVLELDLAKLWADVGAFDRAAQRAVRAQRTAARIGSRFFEAAAAAVLGEVALARGETAAGIDWITRARVGFEREGARREVVEEDLELAAAELSRGDLGAAEAALHRVAAERAAIEADDLASRFSRTSGHLALARGDVPAASEAFDRAIALAERTRSVDLVAEALASASGAARAQGDETAAASLEERARVLWREVATRLAPGLVEGFRAHPRRRQVLARAMAEDGASVAIPADLSRRLGQLERLLAVFRELNASHDTEAVLSRALDAAVELTLAERGFVIVTDPDSGALTVPVARNVDRDAVGKGEHAFSRSIAERAIASGEPVVTVDATEDARFREQVSVHAMQLRSVMAVPIRSPDGVLGALYLDNRFSRARFGRVDVDLLLAFADQVALALRTARTLASLRKRTEDLEAERRRVEELARGQAEQIDRLALAVRVKQQALEHRYDYGSIIGRGPAMQKLFATLDRVIDTPIPILVLGESGTGKELVARAIHFQSERRAAPFVGLNCAALPPTLLESELFGHVRGAFTGADRDRVGLIALASGGTLFLDELGELPLEVQAKLLRVLQEKEVRPLGSTEVVPVDFRLVSATNRDLASEVARGRFREDLYYRVGVVELTIPPLRERFEDLPRLVEHFCRIAAKELGRPAPRVTPAAQRRLLAHAWPGNVRELENVITRAIVLAEGAQIGPDDIELSRASSSDRRRRRTEPREERAAILSALDRAEWNAASAARDLGMSRATLYRRLDRLEIARP